MANNTKLILEVNALTERLKKGEVTFLEVAVSLNQRVVKVSGEPQYESDPLLRKALEDLSEAAALSYLDHGERITQQIAHDLAFNTAVGKLGADFFSSIISRK